MPNAYTARATAKTPALIVYLLDVSKSMNTLMGGRKRLEIVESALKAALERMVARSTKGVRISPRYRVAMFAYSNHCYDVLGGAKPIDQIAEIGVPMLEAMDYTDTAAGFREVERLLQDEVVRIRQADEAERKMHPAPLVCHMTDAEFNMEDPEPIAQNIMKLSVADGSVLVANIFICGEMLAEPIRDLKKWPGITDQTRFTGENAQYAEKLRRMSSLLPPSYRALITEEGYRLAENARLMFPGTNPALVELGFQMSTTTPAMLS